VIQGGWTLGNPRSPRRMHHFGALAAGPVTAGGVMPAFTMIRRAMSHALCFGLNPSR